MNKCHQCLHVRSVPGNCHVSCAKPDPHMRGDAHGVRSGWFIYPLLFDPIWAVTQCANYTPREVKS